MLIITKSIQHYTRGYRIYNKRNLKKKKKDWRIIEEEVRVIIFRLHVHVYIKQNNLEKNY